ncbi:MAG TPA: hypothetical protein VM577_02465 [Anaerovoracaceae bacterium]|nr:hypothetical protein [Anaerovoracaceae bacterium]
MKTEIEQSLFKSSLSQVPTRKPRSKLYSFLFMEVSKRSLLPTVIPALLWCAAMGAVGFHQAQIDRQHIAYEGLRAGFEGQKEISYRELLQGRNVKANQNTIARINAKEACLEALGSDMTIRQIEGCAVKF